MIIIPFVNPTKLFFFLKRKNFSAFANKLGLFKSNIIVFLCHKVRNLNSKIQKMKKN